MNKINLLVVALAMIAIMIWINNQPHMTPFPDITAPVTEDDAWIAAKTVADVYRGSRHSVSSESQSMGNAVSSKAYVVLIKRWDEIEPNQIIATNAGEGFVLHRAVYYKNGQWRTSGDANRRSDAQWVTEDIYFGTLVAQFYYKE